MLCRVDWTAGAEVSSHDRRDQSHRLESGAVSYACYEEDGDVGGRTGWRGRESCDDVTNVGYHDWSHGRLQRQGDRSGMSDTANTAVLATPKQVVSHTSTRCEGLRVKQ